MRISDWSSDVCSSDLQQRTRMRMRQIDDPLLRDRMHDLEDLSNRLIRIVSGQMGTAAQMGLRQDSILIARNLGPAELLERSEEHTSELQSLMRISYAVFCLKKKNNKPYAP